MGIIVSAGKFSPENLTGLPKPIIYCVTYPGITDQAVSLNIRIARMLETYSAKHRTMQVERCFHKALSELPDGFELWGEPLASSPLIAKMQKACLAVRDEFSNYQAKIKHAGEAE